jgi:cellulose synthase/poly-beta-1,6-N-acetylglucosamine synthase-like glycosyltransferase
MSILAATLLVILLLPAALSACYLMLLTLLSAKPKPAAASARGLRFDVIVPAHNEAPILGRTIASLQRIEWPNAGFRIIVVADNCADATAEVAMRAGVEVWRRHDPARRGKGYALQHAFDASRADQWADAVVVVDADSDVSANILDAFAARLQSGMHAVQAHYGVRNPMLSWRTRLLTIAMSAFMRVRSRARERLGLSCGIRGNGWCVTHRVLERVAYRAFSLAEDVEYGVALGLAGYRVAYADEADANSDMVASEPVARSQRQRWEEGRFLLIRTQTAPLLARALERRSALCLDLALDLLVLPLSYVVLLVLGIALLAAAGAWLQLSAIGFLWVALGCLALLALYVGRGWSLSGVGAQGIWDLARAPWFLIWKLLLKLHRGTPRGWVRTEREDP